MPARTTTISALAAGAAVVGLVMSGCGSGGDGGGSSSSSAASSSAASSSAAPSETTETSAAAPAAGQTIGAYLTANGVTQTIVKPDQPGVPKVDLPMPEGWEQITGPDVPQDAYGAIYLSSAKGTPNPPAIIARMAKLEGGQFDVAKVLELAPNAVTITPGWKGPTTGQPSELGGFEAVTIAGTAEVDGAPMFVARKTVVIPGPQNTYLLALDAQGAVDQQQALTDAMTAVDDGTTITP